VAPSHRAVRPRYWRIGFAASALTVTTVAVLGAVGVIPGVSATDEAVLAGAPQPPGQGALRLSDYTGASRGGHEPPLDVPAADADALPAGSGSGKRVVFDLAAQRVWLVDRGDEVSRTYLVSGSVTDNLKPGTYEVYSTSRHAVGIDDSGTMQYMVRFAHGEKAAIGFHDIPVDDGRLVQTRGQLGTPQSHGCVRQWRPDARALWSFAGVGTKVVVTA
jgi:lipoprotein-anchoring transpeptidase ErfK/SrfK